MRMVQQFSCSLPACSSSEQALQHSPILRMEKELTFTPLTAVGLRMDMAQTWPVGFFVLENWNRDLGVLCRLER